MAKLYDLSADALRRVGLSTEASMEKQTRESYPWADLKAQHHLFFPGRTMKGFKTTVYEAAKRHGFQLRCCEVAMGGETGVLVWRKK